MLFYRISNKIISIISYCLGIVIPKDPRLIIVGGRYFGGNTRPVFEHASAYGMKAVWLTRNIEILSLGHKDIVSVRSLKGLWLACRAGSVLFTHTLSDFGPLRFPSTSTFLFNLWHGMPIKRIGVADPGFIHREHAQRFLREIPRYDAILATSQTTAEILSKAFDLPYERFIQVGQPRTDVILNSIPQNIENLYSTPLPDYHRMILYCPTWRENQKVKLLPFDDRDDRELQNFLEELNAIMFIRTHPQDLGRLETRNGRLIPLQADIIPEITDILSSFDVLVTDYSSIYYDFLLLNRPSIFIPYDLVEYEKSPGFFLPFTDIAAGPIVKSQSEFIVALREAFRDSDGYSSERKRVKDIIYSHCDALATNRVLEFLDKCKLGERKSEDT